MKPSIAATPLQSPIYYIIDDQFRILQFCDEVLQGWPDIRVGEKCYKVANGLEVPCPECPLFQESGSSVMCNRRAGWLRTEVIRVDWPGIGPCNMMVVHPATAQEASTTNASEKVNALTGLYNREAFLRHASTRLQRIEGKWCLLVSDVDHFTLFNQWYGVERGDEFLRALGDTLRTVERDYGALAGYFGNDDFALLMPGETDAVEDVQDRLNRCVRRFSTDMGFAPAFGIYPIQDRAVPPRTMYDYARIALGKVKGNYASRALWYDEQMSHQIENDHIILSEVQRGIDNGEFCVYAQPQVNMVTGKIVGMEALVRWRHPTRGIVSPGSFIPLLESNGFISKLDTWLWENVAQNLRRWMDSGHQALPISVNVSRMDMYALDVVAFFADLLHRYNLPPRLLEVEITESAYAEDYVLITKVVNGLHDLGMYILMDDFGSGYSSLNMLREIPVNILKLDMKFLQMSKSATGRGVSVLESIVNMAHIMDMCIVAEGVETEEQKRILLDMNCQFAQGYLYYRPMPLQELENLLCEAAAQSMLDYRGVTRGTVRRLDVRNLLKEWDSGGTILNHILGALVIYRLRGDHLTIDEVSDEYYRITGTALGDLDVLRRDALATIPPEDRPKILAALETACQLRSSGAEVDIRRKTADERLLMLHLRVYHLCTQGRDQLFYCVITNNTGIGSTQTYMPQPETLNIPAAIYTEPGPKALELLRDYLPIDLLHLSFPKGSVEPQWQVLSDGYSRRVGGPGALERILRTGRYKNRVTSETLDTVMSGIHEALEKGEGFMRMVTISGTPKGETYVMHVELIPIASAGENREYLCLLRRCPGVDKPCC